MKKALVVITIAMTTACGLVLSLDPLEYDPPFGHADASQQLPDAFVPVQDADVPNDLDLDLDDAALVGDAITPVDAATCNVRALQIVNATPGGTGTVCAPAQALAAEGGVAGLDLERPDPEKPIEQIDGRFVSSCIAAEFSNDIIAIEVRIASTAKACGQECTTQCGTSRSAYLYAGHAFGQYKYVGVLNVTPTLKSYAVKIPDAIGPSRYAVVCRTGAGYHRDDLIVDAIRGCTP